jgi:hypothetical protein
MGRGIDGLPKVSLGPALPDPSMPCGQDTPETALWPFWGWSASRAGTCGHLLPPWIPHAVQACTSLTVVKFSVNQTLRNLSDLESVSKDEEN